MASTNKTTHYELSQYIGTDKPTYLTDYNQDMSKIDTGIHEAKAIADVNSESIGTLSNLTTTVKSNLVAAVNEVDGNTDTNTTAIGDLTNLNTTAKNNLVAAVNEVSNKTSDIGDLTNLTTTAKNNLVAAVNEVNQKTNQTIPVGTTFEYAGSVAPEGYLLCQGQAVSRSTYSNLFAVIGTYYGAGDESTTFNLPNFKGKIGVGLDSNDTDFNLLGKTGGSKDLQEHTHDYLPNSADIVVGEQTRYTVGEGEYSYGNPGLHINTTQPAGTGNAGNLQPYVVINKIIKY